MTDAPTPDEPGRDALARARRTRVVVVGGGIAGLVAALEWAKIGAPVTVLEASDRFGGMVETVELDGLPVDAVVDAFPLGSTAFGALLDDLGLRERVEPATPHPVWIAGLPGGAAPLSAATVLGIPANPWAADVRRLIGWRGAWRAYLDRLRPPLTIGHERSLGRLVRSRMGARVVDRLVAPVTRGLYGVEPDDIDVETAAPGLNTALTRTGSLAGAAADLLPEDGSAPARATLRGGMGIIVEALVLRLRELGADLRTDVAVTGLAGAQGSHAALVTYDDDRKTDAPPTDAPPTDAPPTAALAADVVVLATDPGTGARLLSGSHPDAPAPRPAATPRDIVTLVVDAPELDSAPRGRGVYAASPTAPAVAVSHPSVDWAWLGAAARPGRHVLRVTLPADPRRGEAERIEDATRAARNLLGVDGAALGEPRAAVRRSVDAAAPASALGHDRRVRALRTAAAARPGLTIVGAWVAGAGLAQIVADTVAEVDRARSAVLWTRDEPVDDA